MSDVQMRIVRARVDPYGGNVEARFNQYGAVDMSIKSICIEPDADYESPCNAKNRAVSRRDRGSIRFNIDGKNQGEFPILSLIDYAMPTISGGLSDDERIAGSLPDMAGSLSAKLQALGEVNAGAITGAVIDFISAASSRPVARGFKLAVPILISERDQGEIIMYGPLTQSVVVEMAQLIKRRV